MFLPLEWILSLETSQHSLQHVKTEVRNCAFSLYDKIVAENPLRVKYSEPSIRGKFHNLNDKINDVFEADVHKKVTPHQIIHKGKTLVF